MPHDRRALTCAADVLAKLRGGDALAHTTVDGWRLVRADVPVSDDAVKLLRVGGFVLNKLRGQLAPMGDCLPGFDGHMSQTWRWAEAHGGTRPS